MAKDVKGSNTDSLATLARIPLGDVLEFISQELQAVSTKAKARGSATMRFEECEVEFAFEAEKSGSGDLKIYVVTLGGAVKRSERNTIRLRFVPLDSGNATIAAIDPVEKQ